jgi:ketosteroid isomerase-like protein
MDMQTEIADFVTRFAAAWRSRDGGAFLDMWHPDGLLFAPLYGRPIKGSEFGALTELIVKFAPDQVWQLLDWTWRPTPNGAVVVIEWQSTRVADGKRFDWRGVDKITLVDGKIAEEIVYFDTAPLRARRSGETLEPLVKF